MDFAGLYKLYRSELLDRTIPFWLKYDIDWRHGGICTCSSDEGQILSGDMYVWSPLRAIWTFSTEPPRQCRRGTAGQRFLPFGAGFDLQCRRVGTTSQDSP